MSKKQIEKLDLSGGESVGSSSTSTSGGTPTGDSELMVNAPKVIVFCIHGMQGSSDSFAGFKSTSEQIKGEDAVFVNQILTKNVTAVQIKNELISRTNIKDRILFARINFSDNKDYVSNQIYELKLIIDKFRQLYATSTKYSLMAHSKGGLVSASFVSIYKGIIDRILTFGTPYNHDLLVDGADNFNMDKTVGDPTQMNAIKNVWNSVPSNQLPETFAVGTEDWTYDLWGLFIGYPAWNDSIVLTDNAMGANYKDIVGIRWSKYYNNNFSHNNMLGTSNAVLIAFDKFD